MLNQNQLQCHMVDAPVETEVEGLYATFVPYSSGMPVSERPSLPGYDSAILSIVVCTMLIVVFSLHNYPNYFKNLAKSLWSVRERTNVFDDVSPNDARTIGAMSLQTVVYEGLLLLAYFVATSGGEYDSVYTVTLASMFVVLTGVYYLWQILVYYFIGYVFADKGLTGQWMQGFYSSQGILGFFLLIPALLGLFYPSSVEIVGLVAVLFYLTARIMFICKGFRIFYHNCFSLVYFILYLCSVEIVPLILMYRGVIFICRISI